jgi:hypothetical protein
VRLDSSSLSSSSSNLADYSERRSIFTVNLYRDAKSSVTEKKYSVLTEVTSSRKEGEKGRVGAGI